MNNFSVDTATFSEQLGVYDFFNVIITGTVFIGGISILNSDLGAYLWTELTLSKGIGLSILIYVAGVIIQEIGALLDREVLNIYKGMSLRILKSGSSANENESQSNDIVQNSLLLKQYRDYAKTMLGISDTETDIPFDNEDVNGYFFSSCQYYVLVQGKCKKTEKLRALFDMSRSLMTCFGLLSIISLFAFDPAYDLSALLCSPLCAGNVFVSGILILITVLFYHRSKNTMKRFLLVLLGTYSAMQKGNQNTPQNSNSAS